MPVSACLEQLLLHIFPAGNFRPWPFLRVRPTHRPIARRSYQFVKAYKCYRFPKSFHHNLAKKLPKDACENLILSPLPRRNRPNKPKVPTSHLTPNPKTLH